MSSSLEISVVVATFNRGGLMTQALPSLLEQDLPPDRYEVVVVVDGSTDGTAEFLRGLRPACALRILEQAHRGQAAALNVGVNIARGHLVLFLDDDTLCYPGLIRAHLEVHQGLFPCVVFGPVDLAPLSPRTLVADWVATCREGVNRRLAEEMEPRWPVDAKVGANASLPRSTFLSSGGFDERLGSPWQRKVELGVRLWKMGVRFKYQPLAKACQIHVKSAREFVERDGRKQGRSEILFLRIHPDLRPYSPLARLGEGSPVKRLAREIIMRSPASPGLFLRVPLWAAGQLRSIPFARLAGIRLLQAGQEIEMSRCALKEVGSWRAYRAYLGLRLPVLMYHHVGPLQSRVFPGISVSSDLFERHIQWLVRRGYVGIRPADWLAWCREGKALPMKPVLLSFDDAYADIADYALPVLQRYGFGAAVFVTTSYVGKTNVWDEAKGWGTLRLMTAEQIRTWATQGIEFGAHTRTHPNLTKLSPAQLQEEVVGSRDDLAALLGTRVISFAYPYGRYNERVRKCVREIFDLAFVTHSGIPNLVTPPELLPRAIVYPEDSPIDLAFLTRWGRNPLHGFRWYTARVKRYVARRAKRILRPGRRTA